VTKASSMLDEEVERLEALLEVNPSIREEEVAHLKAKRDQILTHLQDAQLRMDAIRIAVVRE
jgi:ATP-dependent helicase HepA